MTTSLEDPQPSVPHRWPRAFWVLLAVALVVRLLLVFISLQVYPDRTEHPAERSDMFQYMNAGEFFATGMQRIELLPPQRDRLLPLILGGAFGIAGGRSIAAAQVADVLVAVSGLFFLFPLARRLMSDGAALLACGLWAFDPQFLGQSCLPLSENVSTPLYIAALYGLTRADQDGSRGWFAFAAAALGVAVWGRAATVLVGIAVVVWLACRRVARLPRWAAITCMVAVISAGWLSASALSYHCFGLFAPNTHTYLLWENEAAKLMVQTGQARDAKQARQIRQDELTRRLGPQAGQLERLKAGRATAIDLVRGHPGLTLRNHAQAFIATTLMPDRWSITSLVGIPSEGGIWHSQAGLMGKVKMLADRWGWPTIAYAGVHFLFTLALWGLAARSMPRWFGQHRAIWWLLALMLLSVLASGTINVEGMPRYRLPAMPMLAMMAAAGWASHRARRGRADSRAEADTAAPHLV